MLSNKLKLNRPKRDFEIRQVSDSLKAGNKNFKGQMKTIIRQIGAILSSLRFRLIGWYVLLLVLTLLFFSIYIFFQFRNLEQSQQDTALQSAASSLRGAIDFGPPGSDNHQLHFRTYGGGGAGGGITGDLNRENIQVRMLGADGQVIDSLGTFVSEMPLSGSLSGQSNFSTLTTSDNAQWRVYSLPIIFEGNIVGWLQLGQPVFLLDTGLNSLFTPIVLGTIIALLLAVLGGLFLANRALNPIDKVTRTAQAITTRDLGRRINYSGPQDEIGRLAQTLDQMLDRLEKGFEQERRFTSDASHELRTPLTALKGRIEVTLNRPRSQQDYQQTLVELNQEVDRLVRLSNSLLYLARLDQAGQNSQQFETFDLSELLESIADSMQGLAEQKQIKLTVVLPTRLEVHGNLDQFTRLFLNLLDNALKYTPAGGEVVLQAEKVEQTGQIRVAVRDTGPGIAEEHLSRLFQRFYRVDQSHSSSTGGAGLGLAIAHEIARQHGGNLEVASKVGKGSLFTVKLPSSEASYASSAKV
jgi:signal transduction histidine kinase